MQKIPVGYVEQAPQEIWNKIFNTLHQPKTTRAISKYFYNLFLENLFLEYYFFYPHILNDKKNLIIETFQSFSKKISQILDKAHNPFSLNKNNFKYSSNDILLKYAVQLIQYCTKGYYSLDEIECIMDDLISGMVELRKENKERTWVYSNDSDAIFLKSCIHMENKKIKNFNFKKYKNLLQNYNMEDFFPLSGFSTNPVFLFLLDEFNIQMIDPSTSLRLDIAFLYSIFPKDQKKFILQLKEQKLDAEKKLEADQTLNNQSVSSFSKLQDISKISNQHLIALMTWDKCHIIKILNKLDATTICDIPFDFFISYNRKEAKSSFFNHILTGLNKENVISFIDLNIKLPTRKSLIFYWSFLHQPTQVLLKVLQSNRVHIPTFTNHFLLINPISQIKDQFFYCWEPISNDTVQKRFNESLVDAMQQPKFCYTFSMIFSILENYSLYLFTEKSYHYSSVLNKNPLSNIKNTALYYITKFNPEEEERIKFFYKLVACFSYSNCYEALNKTTYRVGKLIAFIESIYEDIYNMGEHKNLYNWLSIWKKNLNNTLKFYDARWSNFCKSFFNVIIYEIENPNSIMDELTEDNKLLFLYLIDILNFVPSDTEFTISPDNILQKLVNLEEILTLYLKTLSQHSTKLTFSFFKPREMHRQITVELDLAKGIKQLFDSLDEKNNSENSFKYN